MTWLAKWTIACILFLLFGVAITNRHRCCCYYSVARNGKTNELWKFLLHCFSPVANICSFPSQGMCLSPSSLWGYRWSRCQCEEWCRAGVHPAGVADLGAGNSITVTISEFGSCLSKRQFPKDEGTDRNVVWVTGGGTRSDHQAVREVQNSNR